MTQPSELTIADDEQLQTYGIFTTESAQADSLFLSRQDFQTVQRDIYDTYPTDDIFILTILSTIERSTGLNRQPYRSAYQQPAAYIRARRPSQPDFLINAESAKNVWLDSRYKNLSINDSSRTEVNKRRAHVLRSALAKTALTDLVSMENYERPLRLSGDVFMTPSWRKKALAKDAFMITLADFTKHKIKPRVDEALVHNIFRKLGIELLGNEGTDSAEFAKGFLHSERWVDGAAGIFSLHLPTAYRVVMKEWSAELDAGRIPAVFDVQDDNWLYDKIPACIRLAQIAVAAKTPREWFNRKGELVPPKKVDEYMF